MRRVIALLASVGGISGCSSGPDQPTVLSYNLYMNAHASDTTPERIRTLSCLLEGNFQLENPAPMSGNLGLALTITRMLEEQSVQHFENTRADTIFSDVTLQYSGLGGNTLNFTLGGGPFTLGPLSGDLTFGQAGIYSGTWNCGPEFPLAQDSTLGAFGYDANAQLDGVWQIQEIRPID
jgi:hypothetical protein